MSIIHEALKKAAQIKKRAKTTGAQKESQTLDSNDKITAIKLEPEPAAKKEPLKKQKFLILPAVIMSMLFLIVAVGFLLNNYLLPKKIKTEGADLIPAKEVLPFSQLPTNKPSPKTTPPRAFVLSGIVYEDKEPMAVINDSIYTVGEYVSGAKITEITRQRVLLEKAGEEIELKVK